MKFLIHLLLLSALFPAAAVPHGGGIDAIGGHNNRTEGTYHFHQGPLDGQSFASKDEASATLLALDTDTNQPTEPTEPTHPDIPPPVDRSPYWPAGQWPSLVDHYAYTLAYDEAHEQARWVLYQITAEQAMGTVERTDNFRADPLVDTGSAALDDYAGSGFDRGHLAPAAAMAWSETAMSESFYLSNMSPQDPGFNRGIWRSLEAAVRGFAITHDAVWVVTGPSLDAELPMIGPNGVSVPEWYYKVVIDIQEPGIEGIGFILRNEAAEGPLGKFAVPIDRIEVLTGMDFFPVLDDGVEDRIEAGLDLEYWGLEGSPVTGVEAATWGSVKGE